MYNFHISTLPEDQSSENFILDENVEVSGHAIRYLKEFQLSAVRFLYNHLQKREFCILNDERGLGKTATASVLLGIWATQKNCFVVVENNDDRVIDWQFHLDILTDLNVKVLNEEKDYSESIDTIYIVKWNTLRLIEDLSKWRIDMVIVDNKEQLLNNSFCTSTLLRNFESKVQLVISSVDITSDVKLMFNILRLGGRLESQLETFKAFEKKFHLPDQNAILNKKSDLEEYFRKREMLKDYCRDFRLRRYCYQYENLLPLVDPQRYSAHIEHWKATNRKKNITATTISLSESIPTCVSTEEVRNSQDNNTQQLDEEVQQINSNSMMANSEKNGQLDGGNSTNDAIDEDGNMSPLIYNSDSDCEEEVEILSSNSIETIIPVVEIDDEEDDVEIIEDIASSKSKIQHMNKRKQNVETQRNKKSIRNDIDESKKAEKQTVQTEQDICSTEIIDDVNGVNEMDNSRCKSHQIDEDNTQHISNAQNIIMTEEFSLTPEMEITKEKSKTKKSTKEGTIQETGKYKETLMESDQCSTTRVSPVNTIFNENENFNEENNKRSVERRNSSKSNRKTSINRGGIHNRITRNMKRSTRSSGGLIFALDFKCDKRLKANVSSKKCTSAKVEAKAKAKVTKVLERVVNSKVEKKNVENPKPMASKPKPNPTPKNSSEPLISPTLLPPSSDCEEIQCGQQLNFESSGENCSQPIQEISNPFLFPSTPPSLRILPMTSLLENDSDVIVVPENNQTTDDEVINLLSGSNNEHKTMQPIRRRRRRQKVKKNIDNAIAKDRTINISKSPDLFSIGSDNGINEPFTQVHCALPTTSISNNTFGFKIFGSEVRRPQETITPSKKNLQQKSQGHINQSCLNMLDNIHEKPNEISSANGIKYALRKQRVTNAVTCQSSNESSNNLITSCKKNHERNQQIHKITNIQPITLSTDDIFEITNNATFGSTLRINATGDISPVQQLNNSQQQQQHHNKITNYLIGNNNGKQNNINDDDAQPLRTPSKRSAIIQQSTSGPCMRKSPKSLKSTQTTKLTKWFRRSMLDDTSQQQQAAKESTERKILSKKNKRRRLDLYFNS